MSPSIFSRIFGAPDGGDGDTDRSPGAVFAFRTTPLDPAVPPQAARYGAFKIIGAGPGYRAVAVLDGVWDRPPPLHEVRSAALLRETQFAAGGRIAVFAVGDDVWHPEELQDLARIGNVRVSREEAALANDISAGAIGTRHATLYSVNHTVEGEWRWANDREAYVAEVERRRAEHEAERAAKEARYRSRLEHLTFETLLAETPLPNWDRSPPYPSPEFTAGARDALREACRSIQALGEKPRKADVRRELRKCVEWFNQADAAAGHAIETDEREEVMMAIEEIAHAARQPSLAEEADDWREW